MKTHMLDSQFATLEVPGDDEPDVVRVGIDADIDTVVTRAVNALKDKEDAE